MTIDPQLLGLLACPSDDHAPLREVDGELLCTYCATRYPISDGLPDLLMDDATPGPNGIGQAADAARS
ncbi:MAG: Trm112 family protein [Actinobacteria bacterium]|nr:Trm112 family protein [Actinomycetota bacterium]